MISKGQVSIGRKGDVRSNKLSICIPAEQKGTIRVSPSCCRVPVGRDEMSNGQRGPKRSTSASKRSPVLKRCKNDVRVNRNFPV